MPAPGQLCPPASTRCADGCMAAAGTRAHQPSDPVFNHTALAATCLAPATRARTKMTDCLEARIRRSTRTGGQAARTGVEAPVRAATGKDVNAHLDWSGVWCMWPGMVAACCSRVGVGVMITLPDTNQDTPSLLSTARWTRVHVSNCCPSMGGGR